MNGVEVSAGAGDDRAVADGGAKYEQINERAVTLRVHNVGAADTASTYECVIETADGQRRAVAAIRINLSGAPTCSFCHSHSTVLYMYCTNQ